MSAFKVPEAVELFYVECGCGEVYFPESGEACSGGCSLADAAEASSGYFGRLSAPGYLDSTEWSGPFDRAWKALRHVCETFEVDTKGEELAL